MAGIGIATKPVRRNASKEFYAWRNNRRRQARVRAIELLGGQCVDCGLVEDLEFDHVDPETKQEHARHVWDWGWVRVLGVLWKFELRCCGCHEIRTTRERHNLIRHRNGNEPVPDWVTENDENDEIDNEQGDLNGVEKEAGQFE